jgi:hypothetical protein
MNCLEFRREASARPNEISDEARTHELMCGSCGEFAAQLRIMDARVHDAAAVPVPEGLIDRVLDAAWSRPSVNRRRFMALAASALAAAGTGLTAYWWSWDDPLALAGIGFVIDEEANAILNAKPAEPGALARVAESMRVSLPVQLGEMRYIGTCPFEGSLAHHVVVTTPHGKATLLLLPEKPVSGRQSASARGLHARVLPTDRGCVAVIASSGRSADRICAYLRRA